MEKGTKFLAKVNEVNNLFGTDYEIKKYEIIEKTEKCYLISTSECFSLENKWILIEDFEKIDIIEILK